MAISERVCAANDRLKSAAVGVAIELCGDRLRLRATLPPKPGSNKLLHHQQRISLGYHANPAGLALAEKEARKIGSLLDCNQFSWEPYLPIVLPKGETIGEWIARFTEWRSQHNPVEPVSWRSDYEQPFKRLPPDEILTVEILLQAITTTKPNTRTRRRYCLAYQQLAKFAGIDFDSSPLIGSYSAKKVNPRDLPDDTTVLNTFSTIEPPGWRWVYGAIAAYGLRPHEAFFTDLDDYPIATVLRGKTGSRFVWPIWPEWPDLWELQNIILPDCAPGQSHSAYGERVTQFFGRNLPFHAYDLRHAWAGRAVEFGLDVSLAAKQMGHSVKVHTETYQMWLDKSVQQRVYDSLVARRSSENAANINSIPSAN
jgi:integrase